jgi:Zn-dependent protease with chaperone function
MKRWLQILAVAIAATTLTPAAGAQSAEAGVQVRKPRLMLVPEGMVNASAAQQYAQLKQQAAARRLLNTDAPQVQRVRSIAQRLIPHGVRFNAKAAAWAWEVNVIDTPAINAFCMPGGKIVVFDGLIDRLALDDDELAAVIGHEIAHALLEHGRARMSEALLKSVGINLAAAYFGLSDVSAAMLAQAAQLAITLPYSRGHEVDADLVGLELAARAGFDPRAAVRVWQKMAKAGGAQPPQFLSTHPGHATRIREIEAALPRVLPLYEAARR